MANNKEKSYQKYAREVTNYEGVYQRVSPSKKAEGKPVIIFSIDYYNPHSGKRIREVVGRSDRKMTAKLASRVRAGRLIEIEKQGDIFDDKPQDPGSIPTLGDAWEKYKLDWLIVKNKASTKNDIYCYATHFLKNDLHNRKLNKISLTDLEKLAASKLRNGYAPQTVVHILGLLRRIMNRTIKWKDWKGGVTPFAEFEMPAVDNERTRFLTVKEAREFLDRLRQKSDRAWVMSLIGVHCGMRFGEIAKLHIRDINFTTNLIFVRNPKNNHSRYVYFPDSLKEVLDNWLYYNSTEYPLVFPSAVGTVLTDVDDEFNEVVKDMKLNDGVTEGRDKFSFHCLRHTFASYLASEGYSLANISEMLGQRDTKMTKRYTHLLPGTHRAAAMHVDKLINEVPQEHQK